MSESKEQSLNVQAKEYIPTKNRLPEKLNFNLQAKEYKPKDPQPQKNVEDIEGEEEEEDEAAKEQMDMMMRDIIEDDVMNDLADDGSDDEEKWYPKYKDCECCHGFVNKCNGESCKALGQCYCKMKDDCDDLDEKVSNK